MKPLSFSRDLQEFLRLLANHDVRYVLIGGTAVIYHGHTRLTGDVDFLFDCTEANARRLWQALLEFWRGCVPGLQAAEELMDPEIVVQFGRPPNRIDLIAGLRTVTFEDAWKNRVSERITVDGAPVQIWILGLEDLKRSKRDAGRPKDLEDLRQLP